MKEAIRHLKRRGSLSGGVIYALRGDKPVPEPVKEEIILKTSPAEPGSLDVGLAELEKMVAGCTKCALHETRTNTVFGAGSPVSNLVFIGEAPGRDEDRQGVPFVGRAGKLLDKMIAAIGFAREDIYIANILKCRPPNNRDPKEAEVAACKKYLARQIELLDHHLRPGKGRRAEPVGEERAPAGPQTGRASLQRDTRDSDIPPGGPAEESELEEGCMGGSAAAQEAA